MRLHHLGADRRPLHPTASRAGATETEHLGDQMTEIILPQKHGGALTYDLDRIRSPRALLALVYEALHRGARRLELLEFIKSEERRLGLELGGVTLDKRARRCARR